MRPRSTLRALLVVVAAVLLALLAVPAGARSAPVQVERWTFSGVLAQASWFTEEEPVLDEPAAVAVFGADAVLTSHVAGGKPVREPQVSGVAWAMLIPGAGPDPVPVEVWAATTEANFTYDRALTTATLSFDAVAEVFGIDETTGEEVPTGETFPVSVTAVWAGQGPLITQRNHSVFTEPGLSVHDRGRMRLRLATAEVVVTTPDGVVFDGIMDGELSRVKAATLSLMR